MQQSTFLTTLLILFGLSFIGAQLSAQSCQISLPPDTVICSSTINYSIQPTGSVFVNYQWNTGSSNAQIVATTPGLYIVNATTASGCTATDSIYIQSSFVANASLGQDRSLCGTSGTGVSFTLDPYIYVNAYTDSLTIIYDAQNGVSGLVGATKVYMHAGAEFVANGGWQTIVGNWGQDNGLGEMTNIGNNKWKINIYPQSYFHYAPSANLHGIYMVFRNADGTATGKDNNNQDFYLDMHTNPIIPLSSYQLAMYGQHISSMPTYLWNTGDIAPTIAPDTSGTYSVMVTDLNGCVKKDTMTTQYFPYPIVDLGQDTVICFNSDIVLSPGSNFAHYSWNTGDTTSAITASQAANYEVFVKNSIGCESYDAIFVASSVLNREAMLTDTLRCDNQNIVLQAMDFSQSKGDSLLIIYDASKGQPNLAGVNSVYMHAGAEITPFGGWQYVKGNWGFDDGIGKMDSIGVNLWGIKIHPQSYFGYSPNAHLEGIWMVFRNPDGTLTGKDSLGGDIYVYVNNGINTPTSIFQGVQADFEQHPLSGNLSYLWNNGLQTTSISASQAGLYTVEISDDFCSITDSFMLVQGVFPTAAFTGTGSALNCHYDYTSQSSNASTYTWNFGDGSPEEYGQNVSHSFMTFGSFPVTLTVQNACGSASSTQYFNCIELSLNPTLSSFSSLQVYPNPAQNEVNIHFDAPLETAVSLKVYNALGQVILTQSLPKGIGHYEENVSISAWAKGTYLLLLEGEQSSLSKIFHKE